MTKILIHKHKLITLQTRKCGAGYRKPLRSIRLSSRPKSRDPGSWILDSLPAGRQVAGVYPGLNSRFRSPHRPPSLRPSAMASPGTRPGGADPDVSRWAQNDTWRPLRQSPMKNYLLLIYNALPTSAAQPARKIFLLKTKRQPLN